MDNKYKKPLIMVAAFLVLSLVSITSYAFFTALVNGNSNAQANVITTGHMEVTFLDGDLVGTASNMLPGDYIDKVFSVTNTGNVFALYDIYLNEVLNTFVLKDELTYELISEDGITISKTECPEENAKIGESIGLDVGQSHHYTIRITFLNKDYAQDYNKGAMFSTK